MENKWNEYIKYLTNWIKEHRHLDFEGGSPACYDEWFSSEYKVNKMSKKYELVKVEGSNLYRIRALKDFSDVKKGDIGGYVESEENLSHEGDCWIYDEAKAYGNARVTDNAQIRDNAKLFENAKVYGDALVCGDACVTVY